ncbi:hypothetical protein [Streptomyces radicis]|uniref:Uncharacterized protein n=1 Tax=Streptomyces radicis TaxID=1750517 RepID=A0A3A9WN09_9ACTN|nr:hypothetical protein [Streptomyces radicis]RKN10854.1 hypothetical protein D7319_06775 [Streptomyces radicis]RKN25118.1 hypothetical protein D7318_07630 [Streptomyces radicis]
MGHLTAEADRYRAMRDMYRRYADAKDAGAFGSGPPVEAMRTTLEAGVRIFDSLAEWADWARARADHAEATGDHGRPRVTAPRVSAVS